MSDFKDFRRAGTQKHDSTVAVLREFTKGTSIEDLSDLYNEPQEAVEKLVRRALASLEDLTPGAFTITCDRIDLIRRRGEGEC